MLFIIYFSYICVNIKKEKFMKEYKILFTSGETMPMGTFYCIGRNYAKHAVEMGAELPKEPMIFIKSAQSLVNNNSEILLPDYSENIHHEVEIVLAIKKDCFNIEPEDAKDFIAGIGIGLDLTLRDLQSELKKNGKPWTIAKSFYQSAPVSNFINYNDINQDNFRIKLEINGEIRQSGDSSDMIFGFDYLISFLSKKFFLRAGDCIFTGTPEGVSQIKKGDEAIASLDNLTQLRVNFL